LSSDRSTTFGHTSLQSTDYDALSFDERVGMLVDREYTDRESRKLTRRLQQAKLRQKACIEDIDYRHHRGLDKATLSRLASGQWIHKRRNIVLSGPTGIGKTFLACALAHKACRDGFTALYRRMPRLCQELQIARADGSWHKRLARIAKTDVLVLDDFGITPLSAAERRDLLEVIEDRHGSRSTIIASQLPVDKWHAYIGEPTLADAIVDRLVHNAHHLKLRGDSMRKHRTPLTEHEDSGN
jgi:DNA replication protein DnaC